MCFDGLPHDYQAVQHKVMLEKVGKGFFWGDTSGPRAYGTSEMAHKQFDNLSDVDAASRSREDCLPNSLLTTIEKRLKDSGADELKEWSHAFLAHAGGPESRKKITTFNVTANKLTNTIKAMSRVTEAVSAFILFDGGRSGSLMPTAQFNQFEKLDKPIMQIGGEAAAHEFWRQLSKERNSYLDGVESELIEPAKVKT